MFLDMNNDKATNSTFDSKEDAVVGYENAIRSIALVSQEIYSRSITMLTANSLIIATISLILTKDGIIFQIVAIFFVFIGIKLCKLWKRFVNHGVYYQSQFRGEAERLENRYFSGTFRLVTLISKAEDGTIVDEKAQNRPKFGFIDVANEIINLFYVIYILIIFMIIVSIINFFHPLWFMSLPKSYNFTL
jgi:hypothetical protein